VIQQFKNYKTYVCLPVAVQSWSNPAWRPLGHISNEEFYFSRAERDANTSFIKNEQFHVQLTEILRSFITTQEIGALHNTKLQLGNGLKIGKFIYPTTIYSDAHPLR
jgi:hypothetical protein